MDKGLTQRLHASNTAWPAEIKSSAFECYEGPTVTLNVVLRGAREAGDGTPPDDALECAAQEDGGTGGA